MSKIKRLLFLHGEKLVFAIIVLLCLWSIFGKLTRDPNALPQPEGDPYKVDKEEWKKGLDVLGKHLRSPDATADLEPIKDISEEVTRQHARYKRGFKGGELQWVFYSKPPRPMEVTVIVPPAKEADDPEARWRTAVAAPSDGRVIAGRDRILVICRVRAGETPGDNGVRFPEPGSVKVGLWRKLVGEGLEDLDPTVADSFRERSAGSVAVAEPAKPEKDPAGPGADNPFGEFMEERERPQPNREEARNEPAERAEPAGSNPVEAWRQQVARDEIEVWKHMQTLAEPTSVAATKWEDLTFDMPAYSQTFFEETFTEERIKEILATGKLPAAPSARKPVEKRPEADKPRTGETAPPAVPAPGPVPVPGPGPGPVPGLEPGPVVPTLPDVGAEDLETKYPKYQDRYFVFLDENVEQNSIYRYRMITYLKANDLPQSVREKEEHRHYDLRVENADLTWMGKVMTKGGERDMVVGVLALTASEITSHLKGERPVRGINNYDEKAGTLYQPTGYYYIQRDPATKAIKSFRDEKNRLTPLAAEQKSKDCFSFFAYTDLVITPQLKTILLATVTEENNVATVRFHVKLATPEGPERSPVGFSLAEPEGVNALTWKDWVVVEEKDGKRQPKWEGDEPVIRTLAEYYAQVKGLRPVPIGEPQKRGNKEWDFSTDWGLVDVKRCTFRIYRYRIREDGKRELIGGAPTLDSRGSYYVVLRSLKKSDQYKRIVYRKPRETGREGEEIRCDVIWEPELDEWIREAKEKRKAAAQPAPAEKAPEKPADQEPDAKDATPKPADGG